MEENILSFVRENPQNNLSVAELSNVLAGVFSMRLRAWRRSDFFGRYVLHW